jgi:hypothetical protein
MLERQVQFPPELLGRIYPTVNVMNRIIVDRSLRSRLDNLDSRLEFCDESGKTLGYFVPASEQERLLYTWARAEFTDEELERARREPGGLTVSELLADLAD